MYKDSFCCWVTLKHDNKNYELEFDTTWQDVRATIIFGAKPGSSKQMTFCLDHGIGDRMLLGSSQPPLDIPLTLTQLFSALLIAIEHQDLLLLAEFVTDSSKNQHLLGYLKPENQIVL